MEIERFFPNGFSLLEKTIAEERGILMPQIEERSKTDHKLKQQTGT